MCFHESLILFCKNYIFFKSKISEFLSATVASGSDHFFGGSVIIVYYLIQWTYPNFRFKHF